MDTSELQPIFDFMRKLAPFDALHEQTIKQCCKILTIVYYSKTQKLVHVDTNEPQLYIVRSGAFEVRTDQDELIDRVAELYFHRLTQSPLHPAYALGSARAEHDNEMLPYYEHKHHTYKNERDLCRALCARAVWRKRSNRIQGRVW